MMADVGAAVRAHLVEHHLEMARAAWMSQAGGPDPDRIVVICSLLDRLGLRLAQAAGLSDAAAEAQRVACQRAGSHPALVLLVGRDEMSRAAAALDHPAVASAVAAPPPLGIIHGLVIAGDGMTLVGIPLGNAWNERQ